MKPHDTFIIDSPNDLAFAKHYQAQHPVGSYKREQVARAIFAYENHRRSQGAAPPPQVKFATEQAQAAELLKSRRYDTM